MWNDRVRVTTEGSVVWYYFLYGVPPTPQKIISTI